MKLRVAALISGGGSTMEAIAHSFRHGRLRGHGRIALVIANRDDAKGLERAKRLNIPTAVIRPADFRDPSHFGWALIDACRERKVNLIGQYGWMAHTPPNVIKCFPGMMINQHPGPLDNPGHPGFGGKGMYGTRVHAARLCFARATADSRNNWWTEAIAQRVHPDYDQGMVLRTKVVPIHRDDTPETLQERVLPVEYEVQIATLLVVALGLVTETTRADRLVLPEEVHKLEVCKRKAIHDYPEG